MNALARRSLFYAFKLPGMYLLIILGLLLDFVIQLPFRILLALERPTDGQEFEDSP